MVIKVVYLLEKVSGKSGSISEKVVLFFRTESSKRKFVFHFFKDICYQIQTFAVVFW